MSYRERRRESMDKWKGVVRFGARTDYLLLYVVKQ